MAVANIDHGRRNSAPNLGEDKYEDEEEQHRGMFEERVFVLTLADKLRMLFDHDFPGVDGVWTRGVWAAGELLEYGGDFNKLVTTKKLQKQEGILFRHMLKFILLLGEFSQLCPPDVEEKEWRDDLQEIADRLSESCHHVDPTSTDKTSGDRLLLRLDRKGGDRLLLCFDAQRF